MADDVLLNRPTVNGGKTIAADDISSVFYQRVKLIHGADGVNDGDVASANPLPTSNVQGGNTQTVNSDGHADIVSHGHPDAGYIHVDYAVTGGTNVDMILIDLSDTTNYPHANTSYIHLEEVFIDVDAQTNAAYSITIGFLENVDATNGDMYELFHLSGTKATGQNQSLNRKLSPNGPKCNSAYVATSDISLNDTKYQTDVNLVSTLNTASANTPSGNGDLVLFINAGAGGANTDFDVEINISYHTH